jgi:hypothetical protein
MVIIQHSDLLSLIKHISGDSGLVYWDRLLEFYPVDVTNYRIYSGYIWGGIQSVQMADYVFKKIQCTLIGADAHNPLSQSDDNFHFDFIPSMKFWTWMGCPPAWVDMHADRNYLTDIYSKRR